MSFFLSVTMPSRKAPARSQPTSRLSPHTELSALYRLLRDPRVSDSVKRRTLYPRIQQLEQRVYFR